MKKNNSPNLLYPAKLLFIFEGMIQNLMDKQIIREFIAFIEKLKFCTKH